MRIWFRCPVCRARHDRGFVDGTSLFRCLGCGYQGHGFSADPKVDRAMFADREAANAIDRSLGLQGVTLGVDPGLVL